MTKPKNIYSQSYIPVLFLVKKPVVSSKKPTPSVMKLSIFILSVTLYFKIPIAYPKIPTPNKMKISRIGLTRFFNKYIINNVNPRDSSPGHS